MPQIPISGDVILAMPSFRALGCRYVSGDSKAITRTHRCKRSFEEFTAQYSFARSSGLVSQNGNRIPSLATGATVFRPLTRAFRCARPCCCGARRCGAGAGNDAACKSSGCDARSALQGAFAQRRSAPVNFCRRDEGARDLDSADCGVVSHVSKSCVWHAAN